MKRIHLAAIAGVFLMLGSCSPQDTEESSTATAVQSAQTERGPRAQPGTDMGLYSPEQHDLYDGPIRPHRRDDLSGQHAVGRKCLGPHGG